MKGVWLRRYLALRLGAALLFGALSALGVIAQPIASVAALVGLPFLAAFLVTRERAPAPTVAVAKALS
jgi:hypothetical protein